MEFLNVYNKLMNPAYKEKYSNNVKNASIHIFTITNGNQFAIKLANDNSYLTMSQNTLAQKYGGGSKSRSVVGRVEKQ
jgi:hypothetical protein